LSTETKQSLKNLSKNKIGNAELLKFVYFLFWLVIEMVDPNILLELVKTQMPFGKYKGRLLCDLPVHYLEWFAKEGWPKGRLGMQLATVYEIKINGLEEIISRLKRNIGT
jgi:uncharacterized protein